MPEEFLCHFPSISESHHADSMSSTEQIPVVEASNRALKPVPLPVAPQSPPKLGALASLKSHWPEYLMEAGLLGAFMVSACVFGALYEFPRLARSSGNHVRLPVAPSSHGNLHGTDRHCHYLLPLGKAVRSTHQSLRDPHFSSLGQDHGMGRSLLYCGAIRGCSVGRGPGGALLLGRAVSDPAVRYVVTTPGPRGPWVALLAEFIIAAILMSAVLYFSNHHRLAGYTGLVAGLLVADLHHDWKHRSLE